MSVGDLYYEDLTPESAVKVLEGYSKGQQPPHGPQIKRKTSAPAAGRQTLLDQPTGPYAPNLEK
jgi:NADH dehydrogenase (ubiquinone) flavoprotein 2